MSFQIKYIICFISISLSFLPTQAKKTKVKEECKGKGVKCGYCPSGTHEGESPYTISFKNEIPYYAAGMGLVGSGLLIKHFNKKDPYTAKELNHLNSNDINPFDRGAVDNNSASARQASDMFLLGGAALPLLFLSNHHTQKDFFPLLVMGSEVYSIISGITLNTKFIFNRTRPLTYNSDFSLSDRTGETTTLSFVSGHTAQTAALSIFMAKVINDYHPNMKPSLQVGLWTFALSVPALTGYLRVKGGKHFNTDVITGYAVGASVGWLVPQLHKKSKNSSLTISPYTQSGAGGLTFNWKLK